MATDALIESRWEVAAAEARFMLAEMHSVEDVKQIIDKAEALRMYHRAAGGSLDVQNAWAEAKLWAQRRAGELLIGMPNAKTGRRALRDIESHNSEPSLEDLGIHRKQSSRWQAIASVEEQRFMDYIDEMKEAGKELTSVGAIKLARKSTNRTPIDENVTHGEVRDLYDLVATGAKFSTIYADPPWQYSNKGTRSAVDAEYANTMTVDQICREPVSQIVHDDAHLHLWTTNAFIFEAKRVLEAWGFEYKSCFVWVKPQMGIGNYWRVSHEFMLLGTRGNLPFNDRGQMSWKALDRTKHSRKPREVREAVESVSPGPYLEMYGREALPAPWTVYGNEVEGSLFDADRGDDGG